MVPTQISCQVFPPTGFFLAGFFWPPSNRSLFCERLISSARHCTFFCISLQWCQFMDTRCRWWLLELRNYVYVYRSHCVFWNFVCLGLVPGRHTHKKLISLTRLCYVPCCVVKNILFCVIYRYLFFLNINLIDWKRNNGVSCFCRYR